MTTWFQAQDGNIATIANESIVICGYGAQGRSHALNLRDSGLAPTIYLSRRGRSWDHAIRDGFSPTDDSTIFASASLIALLTPDSVQTQLWETTILPTLTRPVTLLFAHGFNIHYQRLSPRPEDTTVLVAPLGQGLLVRSAFEGGSGVPSLIAVDRDPQGHGLLIALAYASGIGSLRAFGLLTTFKEETEIDLFAEQVILCGGLRELAKKGFETLTEAGYQPEIAYYSCVKELQIATLLSQMGPAHYMKAISDTARYGAYTRGPRIIDSTTKQTMNTILLDIQSGRFADEMTPTTIAKVNAALDAELTSPIEQTRTSMESL